jgi:hypothetical protein
MKKQKLWLWFLLAGNLFMSCSIFLSPFIKLPADLSDFLKGLGTAFILIAAYLKLSNRTYCSDKDVNALMNHTEQ